MGRLKIKNKSSYASGAPPCPVTIEGGKHPLSKAETLGEYNGLLITIAALLEDNNGRVLVSKESIDKVKKEKRVIRIIPGELSLSVEFDTFSDEPVIPVSDEESHFLDSAFAQEAREFLAKQKEENVT